MTDAERIALKNELMQQATMTMIGRGSLYSSVFEEYLRKTFLAIDNGTYKSQAEVKLDNVHLILKALFENAYAYCSTIVGDSIKLMLDIIESKND